MAQSSPKSSKQSTSKRRAGSSGNGAAPKSRSRASTSRSRSGNGSSRSRSANASTKSRSTNASSKNRSASASSKNRSASASKGPVATARGGAQSAGNAITSAADKALDGAQGAGHAIGTAAGKAKVPAAAGGAALAGLVGGMAIATRGGGKRRVLGVPVPGTRRPLVKITRKADGKHLARAAGEMAQLANEVRMARQQREGSRRRSPVEVVLEGLTSRRSGAG